MRLLFVASDPMEYPGILAHTTDARPAKLPLDWARAGRLGDHEVLLVAHGAGALRAAIAVETAAAEFHPDAIASTGFCGALDPELKVADIVVGTEVDGFALQPVASAAPHRAGRFCSLAHVAQTAAEKARLHASGGIAVEMEAAGITDRAELLGLPVYCVRAVTDLAGEDMANDFSKALRPDGHFDTMTILSGALFRPWKRVPELIRLRQRCARAAHTLGDFIADCRF